MNKEFIIYESCALRASFLLALRSSDSQAVKRYGFNKRVLCICLSRFLGSFNEHFDGPLNYLVFGHSKQKIHVVTLERSIMRRLRVFLSDIEKLDESSRNEVKVLKLFKSI